MLTLQAALYRPGLQDFNVMNFARLLVLIGLIAIPAARAVYAPLPEPGEDKDWTISARAGVMHDSNIFGSQTGKISSMVYQFSPRIAYNGSLTDQTFVSFGYTLALDHFDKRPGAKTVDSHDLSARLAHSFGPGSNLDVSDDYQIARNPESLLAGLPISANQSFKRNEFNARYVATPAPKWESTLKFRSVNFQYDNPVLAGSLDRTENLFGVAVADVLTPKLKLVGEYRHQDIGYDTGSATKNKKSDFLMAGADYAIAKKFSFSGRIGNEWRKRSSESSTSGLYSELSAKYDYAERSFLAAGYVYTLEETSNVALYTDTRVNRLFVNVQHALSALIVASGSITYEPSVLQGRQTVTRIADVDETTTRLGLAITWLPTVHWAFSASYDHDKVSSDDVARGQERDRVGVSATYGF